MNNLRSCDTLKLERSLEEDAAQDCTRKAIIEPSTLKRTTSCTAVDKTEKAAEEVKRKTIIKIITRKKPESFTSASTTGGTAREAPKKITLKVNPSKKPRSSDSDATIPLLDTTNQGKIEDGDGMDEQFRKEPAELTAYKLSWFNYHTRKTDRLAGYCPECTADWRTEEWVIGLPDSLQGFVDVPPDREWHRNLYVLAVLATKK
ncbi:hypothetical protein NW762_008395 [Fusarium torreyae]|uniref:Uncharacterized protein n=1 Tax=Fusarium torreyae TaxID=1237075 RepID=A0A9W8VDM1_9HYPO|nr:hypothetical protein NW762_008395 [Fusarium torreyae]